VLRSPTAARERPGWQEEQRASAEQRRRLKQLHWDKLKQAGEGTVWSRANRDKLHLDLAQLESLFQASTAAVPPPLPAALPPPHYRPYTAWQAALGRPGAVQGWPARLCRPAHT
jgi:hypothetical protein